MDRSIGFACSVETSSACRTSSVAARRSAPTAAYEHTACAAVQPARSSCCAGREQCPGPLPREPSPDLHPESLPSARRRASPPSRSVAAPNLPAAEVSCCSRLRQPSRATILLLAAPALQWRIRRIPAASIFPGARRCPARMPQSARLRIQVLVELFLRGPHRPPLLSYLPPPPAPPVSSTPGYSLSWISTDADRTCQTHRPPRGARLPVERLRFSRSQSKPNRVSRAAEFPRAAAESALRFP